MNNNIVKELRKKVTNAFKLNGFVLASDALSYLVGILAPLDDPLLWTGKVLDRILKQNLSSSLIRKSIVETAVKECGKETDSTGDDKHPIFEVIDAFSIPRCHYDPEKKKYLDCPTEKQKLFAGADIKDRIMQDRYTLLYQRTLHHPLFNPRSVNVSDIDGDDETARKFTLRTIDSLQCSKGLSCKPGEEVVVLGLLSQLKERVYFLEDPTGRIEISFSDARFYSGLYCEGCFVLAEGVVNQDGRLEVQTIGMPPPESRTITKDYHGKVNFFGGTKINLSKERMLKLHQEYREAFIVFLSDVHFDHPETLPKLKILLQGYATCFPIAIVLMGNFSSCPVSPIKLKDYFLDFAKLVEDLKDNYNLTKFIIVPGPNDPGFPPIFPRPPFPDVMVSGAKEKFPENLIFTSNPVRLRFCDKEMIVIREDICSKMCRNTLHMPTLADNKTIKSLEDIHEHIATTILGQGHLAPFPLHVFSVYWPYDHALQVYPVPDLIVLADKGKSFTHCSESLKTVFINPGPFVQSEFSFKVFTPFANEVEDCQIPSD